MSANAGLVEAAIDAGGERWFPGLASQLAETRWLLVESSVGLTRRTYGTGRYLAEDPSAPRDKLTDVNLPASFEALEPVIVEMLHGCARGRYADLGLDFRQDDDVDARLVRARLTGAFEVIAKVPAAAAAIGALLAALHVVRPQGPDYDASYSDPLVPFSIFVGISGAPSINGDLRLAEGILHECMHLQLSLIEQTIPLVSGSDELYRSPWQQRMRPSQGVLHGLYVFRVIQRFHRVLLESASITADQRRHLTQRIDTINDEVSALSGFAGSRDLTETGRRLVETLLNG